MSLPRGDVIDTLATVPMRLSLHWCLLTKCHLRRHHYGSCEDVNITFPLESAFRYSPKPPTILISHHLSSDAFDCLSCTNPELQNLNPLFYCPLPSVFFFFLFSSLLRCETKRKRKKMKCFSIVITAGLVFSSASASTWFPGSKAGSSICLVSFHPRNCIEIT